MIIHISTNMKNQMSTSWQHRYKGLGILSLSRLRLLGTVNVRIQCLGNPSHCCWITSRQNGLITDWHCHCGFFHFKGVHHWESVGVALVQTHTLVWLCRITSYLMSQSVSENPLCNFIKSLLAEASSSSRQHLSTKGSHGVSLVISRCSVYVRCHL